MSDLILKTHAQALQRNLEKVKDFLTAFKNREENSERLSKALDQKAKDMLTSLQQLDHAIEEGIDEIRYPKDPSAVLDIVLGRLKEARDETESLHEAIKGLALLTSMQTISFQLDRGIKDQLEKTLQNRAGDYVRNLEAAKNNPDAQAGWKVYHDSLITQALPFFSEYLDFLGGLAVRDVGFDAGICQLADELIAADRLSGDSPSLLTIPVTKQAVTLTLERIIRVSFPEWTIWALPFTAHEFWYVMTSQNRKVEQLSDALTAGSPLGAPFVHLCLADAFATYTMGLAYAYSSIVLRFDPFSVSRSKEQAQIQDQLKQLLEKLEAAKIPSELLAELKQVVVAILPKDESRAPTDAERAYCIFAMLEWLDGQVSAHPWTGLIKELRREWDDALRQVDPGQQDLDPKIKLEIDKIVRDLAGTLHRETYTQFPIEKWGRIEDWSQKLGDGQMEGLGPQLETTDELRYVLNAAWRARLRDPEKTDSIAQAAQQLWKLLLECKKTPAEQRRPLVRPPSLFARG